MVLNALGFSSRAPYLMPDYLHNKPVDLLISPGLSAEDFNDDSLGRSLDTLYAKGVTEVFAQVAELAPGYWGKEVEITYSDIPQRWLVVFSQAAHDREIQTRTRTEGKELQTAKKQWHKLYLQTFKCQADAQTAGNQFNQRWKFHHVHAEIVPITQYARRGRPAAEDQPAIVGYGLQGNIVSDPERVERAKHNLGKLTSGNVT
jgi:transposase